MEHVYIRPQIFALERRVRVCLYDNIIALRFFKRVSTYAVESHTASDYVRIADRVVGLRIPQTIIQMLGSENTTKNSSFFFYEM